MYFKFLQGTLIKCWRLIYKKNQFSLASQITTQYSELSKYRIHTQFTEFTSLLLSVWICFKDYPELISHVIRIICFLEMLEINED